MLTSLSVRRLYVGTGSGPTACSAGRQLGLSPEIFDTGLDKGLPGHLLAMNSPSSGQSGAYTSPASVNK